MHTRAFLFAGLLSFIFLCSTKAHATQSFFVRVAESDAAAAVTLACASICAEQDDFKTCHQACSEAHQEELSRSDS